MVTLQDPTRQRDPSSRHAFPDVVGEPKLIARRTLAEELLAARATPTARVHVPPAGVAVHGRQRGVMQAADLLEAHRSVGPVRCREIRFGTYLGAACGLRLRSSDTRGS
jgi:hypothetical protein